MGFVDYIGRKDGPEYEAWSAYMTAFAKVEKVRVPLWTERVFDAVDAGEDFAEAVERVGADLDMTHPWPDRGDYRPEDYIGVTTAAEGERIQEAHPGTKPR